MLFDLVVLGKETAGLEIARQAADLGQRVGIVNDPHHFASFDAYDGNLQTLDSVSRFSGATEFVSSDALEVRSPQDTHQIRARKIVLACGSRAKRPQHIAFDGQQILDSDEVANVAHPSQSWLVVGAGDRGLKTTRELIAKGARVSIVDQCPLVSKDNLAWDAIRELECPVHWGTTILGAERRNSSVMVYHENGSIETYGGVVFAVGRWGCTGSLQLPRPDLLLDETQRVWCNAYGQTGLSPIYAVGSVVGFPQTMDSPQQEAARVIQHLFHGEIPIPRLGRSRVGKLLVSQG